MLLFIYLDHMVLIAVPGNIQMPGAVAVFELFRFGEAKLAEQIPNHAVFCRLVVVAADAADVSSWAEDVLAWANAEGLINGMTATTIDPQGATTRAQTAAMFERFLTAHEA